MYEIIWVDSDPYISLSAEPLRQLGCKLTFFNETKDCLDYILSNHHNHIFCIITSMMERGGRKERGLMNAFQMINKIRYNWKNSYFPFLVMITCTADVQQCKNYGFDVIEKNRNKMMNIIIKRFNDKSWDCHETSQRGCDYLHPNVIVVGIGGCSRSGKTVLTKELMIQYKNLIDKNSDFVDICSSAHLDRYFNRTKINNNQVKTNLGNYYGNWEFPGALDWDDFHRDIYKKIKEISEKIKNSSTPNKKGILFIEGFLLYSPFMSNKNNEINYLNLFDYYIYICLNKSIARERRMKTTTVPSDYYDCILWPEHIKYCSKYVDYFKNKNNKNNILIIDGNKQYNHNLVATCILKWIGVHKKIDINNNEIYNSLFTSFDNQMNLLENNFK